MDGPPVVVRLTPPGRGAVATLAVEGAGALEAVASLLRPAGGRRLEAYASGRLAFGIFGPDPGEEVVVRIRSEQSIEIHCHGGQAAIARVEALLVERGCRDLAWQAWSVQQHDDPIAAAAHAALAAARTERTAAILLDQYQGALRRALGGIQEALATGDAAAAAEQIAALLGRAEVGRHLIEPWRVVLAGPPNAGKSSLINALLGYQRALVHPTAGTTRDVVTATTAIEGWPVELSDTAGLRPTEHALERAGIELARQRLAEADLIVLVFDTSQPWSQAEEQMLADHPGAIVVHNKIDLALPAVPPRPPGVLTSAATGQGVGELLRAIARRLLPDDLPRQAAVPFTAQQVEALQAAAAAIGEGNLALASAVLHSL